LIDDTAPDRALPLTSSSPSGLAAVEHDISRACDEARRERSSVTLIAVSKTFGAEAIEPVILAGQRVFGENRVQERNRNGQSCCRPSGIALHLIGRCSPTRRRMPWRCSTPFIRWTVPAFAKR